MSTDDNDTDPSTPKARRSSQPGPEDTDPGVGNVASEPAAAPGRPLGIVVPPPSTPALTPTPTPIALQQLKGKDSVEILLEGMIDQHPDRTRTAPQSDGQASAAYHAEHTPYAGDVVKVDDVPKVLLDRPLTPTSVRIRTPVRANSTNATVIVPPDDRVGLRLLTAVAAGLMVASLTFLALEMYAARQRGRAVSHVPAPISTPAAAPADVSTQTGAVPASASASVSTSASAPAAAPAVRAGAASTPATGSATTTAASAKRKPKPAPTSSADLGEFRTNF